MTTTPPPRASASPALADGLATQVTAIYGQAETAILLTIATSTRAALNAAEPTAAMYARTAAVQTAVRRVLDRTEAQARAAVPRALAEAYRRGHGLTAQPADTAVRSLLNRLGQLRYGIVRWVTGVWNRLIGATHGRTPRATADLILQREAGRGITAADAGRNWHVPYRIEQIVAHTAATVSMDGWMQRVHDDVGDYVIVNRSETACPKCRPWVGRILCISGADPTRPSVREARMAGLWHPNCQHPALIWRPGFRWPDWAGVGDGGTRAAYAATQRERVIERHIEHWRRRYLVALDDVGRALARRKVRQWQLALADHRRAYGLSVPA